MTLTAYFTTIFALADNGHKRSDSTKREQNVQSDLLSTVFTFCYFFSLNTFILHRLRNKFLRLKVISLDFAFWDLHQYSHRMCGPWKTPKLTPAPGNRTRDLKIAKPTLYQTLLTTSTLKLKSFCWKSRSEWDCIDKYLFADLVKSGIVWERVKRCNQYKFFVEEIPKRKTRSLRITFLLLILL